MLVATDGPAPEKSFLLQRWRQIRADRPQRADLTGPISGRWDEPVPVDDVPTLTDDYAPTDALLLN
jgi:hypothetical protein